MKKLTILTCILIQLILNNSGFSQILTVDPDSVTQGQALDIEITAKNIDFTQGTNVVTLKQVDFEEYLTGTAKDAETLILNHVFNTDYNTGNYDISIWNTTSGIKYSKSKAIYVKPDDSIALLDSITPKNATQDDSITMLLYATNTNYNLVENEVYLKNSEKKINAYSIMAIDSATLEAKFMFNYSHPTGDYSIKTENSLDGTLTIEDAFQLKDGANKPNIISIIPDTLTQGQYMDVEVTANNIDFTQGTNIVSIKKDGYEEYILSTANSANKLLLNQTFNSDHPTGSYDLSIFNTVSGITLFKSNGIFVNPDLTKASLDSINPSTAKQGKNIFVTIYGTNSNFDKAENSVYLYNSSEIIKTLNTNVVDSTTLEALLPLSYSNSIGLYDVFISNDLDGTMKISDGFEIIEGDNAPNIISVSPDTLILGKTLDIEITGTNIDFSQGTNVVSLSNTQTKIYMNSSFAVDSNKLKANFTIDSNLLEGLYSMEIYNTNFDITLIEDQTLLKEKILFFKSARSLPDDIVIGISKTESNPKPLIYPNPTSQFINIREKFKTVQIFDICGQKVLETNNERGIIDLSNIKKGLYIISIDIGNEVFSQKLILK